MVHSTEGETFFRHNQWSHANRYLSAISFHNLLRLLLNMSNGRCSQNSGEIE